MVTGYLSLGHPPDGDWPNRWHCTKQITTLFSNRKW